MVENAIQIVIASITFVANNILGNLFFIGNVVSLKNMFILSMSLTIVIWIIGGMIRHNGNS